MKKLAKTDITLKLMEDGKRVIASLFENEGYRHYDLFNVSDLPNDLISLDDLKRFGIDIIHM